MFDSYRFAAGDNELDDFDYDVDHVDMQSEVGAYGGGDEEDAGAAPAPGLTPGPPDSPPRKRATRGRRRRGRSSPKETGEEGFEGGFEESPGQENRGEEGPR